MANNIESKTIYDIFRSCRLCGSGGGYKMPIIQTIIPVENNEVELRHKIKECLQLEVQQEDKMPPLICELCVDKVNDFYEFLGMCQNVNTSTRKRLGLPLQTTEITEAGDCILGITEPIFVRNDNPNKPRSKVEKETEPVKPQSKKEIEKNKPHTNKPRSKIKKEIENSEQDEKKRDSKKEVTRGLQKELQSLIQEVTPGPRTSRSSTSSSASKDLKSTTLRSRKSSPPARETRTSNESEKTPARLQKQEQKITETPKPKTSLKKEIKKEKDTEIAMAEESDDSSLTPKGKRTREKEVVKQEEPEPPQKRIKITIKLPTQKPGPKSRRPKSPSPVQTPKHACSICGMEFKAPQAVSSHLRSKHMVGFSSEDQACNSCGEWYLTTEEAANHHKMHKSKNRKYKCRHCTWASTNYQQFNEHVKTCPRLQLLPDVKCEKCSKSFTTETLKNQHTCVARKPAPNSKKNTSSQQNKKNIKKPEPTPPKKKATRRPLLNIGITGKMKKLKNEIGEAYNSLLKSPAIKMSPALRNLPPVNVRIIKCDALLKKKKGRYNVANISKEFGLDKYAYYPYKSSYVHIKTEPQEKLQFNGMVSINKEIREEIYREEDYVHWDTDDSSDEEDMGIKKVPSLTALALKTIYSRRCLGKVPKKLRKVKDKFDLFNTDDDYSLNISNIISNLGDDLDGDKNGDVFDGKSVAGISDTDKDVRDGIMDSDNHEKEKLGDSICEIDGEQNTDGNHDKNDDDGHLHSENIVDINTNDEIDEKNDDVHLDDGKNCKVDDSGFGESVIRVDEPNGSKSDTATEEITENDDEKVAENDGAENNVDTDKGNFNNHENETNDDENFNNDLESLLQSDNLTNGVNGKGLNGTDNINGVNNFENGNNSKNEFDNAEIDDRKLLEDIDEQIGTKSNDNISDINSLQSFSMDYFG